MKKITFSLLVILLVGSSNYSSSQTLLTDTNINEAVDLWVSDQTVAESTYGHISNWDTSNITDMFALFYGKTSFNDNIGNWDVSNVTDMFAMFEEATSFNQPIDNWDVTNVTDMYGMFSRALSFDQSISSWDVSNVTNMSNMFGTTFTETSSFNQPIGNWDVGSVTDMSNMFGNSPFNQPIGEWDVSNVTDMSGMFGIATSFDQPIGNWDVSNITKMSYMFFSATSFNQPIDNWNVTNVTLMYGIFQNATSFNQSIGSWDVSNIYNMSSMFENAESFNQSIDNWNVTNATDMRLLFKDATSFNQPIGNWDVSNVSEMYSMFNGAASFNQPIGNWDVNNVESMYAMFDGAASFNQPLGSWDVSNVWYMFDMFKSVNLSIENYDSLLNGWASLGTLQSGVYFNGGGSEYCNGETARASIINTYGWTITDGGLDCDFADNCLTTENANGYLGATTNINLILESSEIINGFQFDITFPDGFVFDPLDITNTGLPESFQVSCIDVGDNSYRVIGMSLSNETIASGTASILTFPTFINEETLEGDYPIPVTNVILSDVNHVSIASLCLSNGIITIYSYFMGDTNGDNAVNTLDVLGTIDYIFGNLPSLFYFDLADVNFDDTINILDVLGIQDIILNPTWRSINTNTTDGLVGDNYLTITNDEFTPNASETIEINIHNDAIVKGMQFDFVLPEGFTLNPADITGTTRLNGFNISAQEISENTFKVLVFSLSSATVASGTGVILNIPLFIESDTSNAVYPVVFTDVIISDTINTDVSTSAPNVGEITFGTLGVNNLESDHYSIILHPNPVEHILRIDSDFEGAYTIYDLNGRYVGKGTIVLGENKVDASFMQSGLYFIKISTNKGVVIKKLMRK